MLQVGQKAPNFTLQNAKGEAVSLTDFLGQKVVKTLINIIKVVVTV